MKNDLIYLYVISLLRICPPENIKFLRDTVRLLSIVVFRPLLLHIDPYRHFIRNDK